MTAKFTISMPDSLVEELDELAKERGATRSAIIQEAMAEYVTKRKQAEDAEAREARRKRVHELLDEVRSAPDGRPDEPVEETIGRLRRARETAMLGEEDDL